MTESVPRASQAVEPSAVTLVLDSHAVLAFLQGEPGALKVAAHLERARDQGCRVLMTSVSLGEIAGVIERRLDLPTAQRALAAVKQLPIEVRPVDESLALSGAHLKSLYGLHYLDALVAALATQEAGAVVTGDRDFEAVVEAIPVDWIVMDQPLSEA